MRPGSPAYRTWRALIEAPRKLCPVIKRLDLSFFGVFKSIASSTILSCAAMAHGACALSPEPHPSGAVGIQLFFPDRSSAWDDADDLGVTWIRLELRWDIWEARQGEFNFSYAERFMAHANKHPRPRIMILFNHPPVRWQNDTALLPARAATALSVFVKRFGARVQAYEIFNEPNLPGEFGWPSGWHSEQESGTVYAKTLAAASSAIRTLDKKAFIISAGLSPQNNPESYARWIVRLTPPNCYDALGIHTYGQQGRFAAIKRNASILFGQEKQPPKPLWATENGTPDNSQRAALITALAAERSEMPITFFFSDRDLGTFTETYGLRTRDGKAKPDVALFKRLLSQ